MAELTMSMTEVIVVLENTLSAASDKLKQIELVEKNRIRVTVSVSKLFPDIPVTLSYHSFSKGRLKLEVSSNYPMKVIQALVRNISIEGIDKDILTLENNILIVNIKDIMAYSINWLDIKDVKIRNNTIIFILTPC